MKILFIFTEIQVKFGRYGFQHGLAALSAYLKSQGFQNIRLCYLSSGFSVKMFNRILANYQPDIVGFYTTHDQFRFIEKLINQIRNPAVFTVCGGPHATLHPQIIDQVPRLDAVCIGEGEEALLELCQALQRRQQPEQIKNLWIRQQGKVIQNPNRPFLENLDLLPFADRELFDQNKIWQRTGLTQISYQNSFRISRGCPYQCSFCSNKQMGLAQPGNFTRFRSVEHVLSEIASAVKRYSAPIVYFEDDTFTLNRAFIEEFVSEYPKRINRPFEFFAHISDSTVPLLQKLKQAGGQRVSFGIESGNEGVRSRVLNKNFSNKEVIRVFKEAKKLGYVTEAFVMAGIPDETRQQFNDTLGLIRTIQPDLYSLSVYFPFAGTDLYEHSVKKGYLSRNFMIPQRFVSRRESLLVCPVFSRREIKRSVRNFGWQVYKDYSFKKAVLFWIYETRLGDILLRFSALIKNYSRNWVIGKPKFKAGFPIRMIL